MAPRVWCWTPNPVLEIKFAYGRRTVSAGGKGHNVARQLQLWGVPAVSLVSETGVEWRQAARKDRVQIREISVRSPARTGWAVLPGSGKRLDFFTEDSHWARQEWGRWSHFLGKRLRKGDWLVVAGSVPTGARPSWWRNRFLELKQKGVRILVDGRGRLLREGLQAGADWAKANLFEAEETFHCKRPSRCLVQMRNLSRGRSGLLLTCGSRGLVLQVGKKAITMPAPRISLQDATGSGDVVSAALIFGIHKKWEIGKIAGFTVWAGSENAARRNEVVARLKGRGGFA